MGTPLFSGDAFQWARFRNGMYQPYLFIYRMNDLKPEMEIQKYDWTTRLSFRRVEDGKGVNLNTILIKLKCENTQHIMDCIELAHPTQFYYFQFSLFVAVSLT